MYVLVKQPIYIHSEKEFIHLSMYKISSCLFFWIGKHTMYNKNPLFQ